MKTETETEACMLCETFSEALEEKVRARPYASLAMAFGAGYILGGGLRSRTTLSVVNLGFKLAMLPFVQDKLLNAVDVVLKEVLKKTR